MCPTPTTRRLVAGDPRPRGLLDCWDALSAMVALSIYSDRQLVLSRPCFARHHNFGHQLADADWNTYLNLDASLIEVRQDGALRRGKLEFARRSAPAVDEQVERLNANGWSQREVLRRLDQVQTTPVVSISMENMLHDQSHTSRFKQVYKVTPNCVVGIEWHPSERVLQAAQKVMAELGGNYVAVHLRRGDVARQIREWDLQTRPPKLLSAMRKFVPPGSPVYLMGDEINAGLLDVVRTEYEPLTFRDFPHLQVLVNPPEPDNFLLYMTELWIQDGAAAELHSYPPPYLKHGAKRKRLRAMLPAYHGHIHGSGRAAKTMRRLLKWPLLFRVARGLWRIKKRFGG